MKKILLGVVAALALAAFTAPVARAEGEGAAGEKPADTAKAKKGKKKSKKAEGEAGGDAAAPAGDTKPAK
jgi:hypothetical protein